jgi:hypothetical protein
MKFTKEVIPKDILQEILNSPGPFTDAKEEQVAKVSKQGTCAEFRWPIFVFHGGTALNGMAVPEQPSDCLFY